MFFKFVLIALGLIISVNSQAGYFRNYYWRIYTDTVPSDAYGGGENENGTTYIGQVMDYDLSPVEIRRGHVEVYLPQQEPKARSHLIKVLCTNDADKFRWYTTSGDDLDRLLATKTVMRGGMNRLEKPYYIGRAFFREQLIVGRVRVDEAQPYMESLYWSAGGYYYHRSTTFDVLVYEDPIFVTDRRT